jgi:hypothetical protein
MADICGNCYDLSGSVQRDAFFKNLRSNRATSTCLVTCDGTTSSTPSPIAIANSLFVNQLGDDSTAERENFTLQFATFEAAMAAAQIGDTIFVYPGDYGSASSILNLTPGVSVFGMDSQKFAIDVVTPFRIFQVTYTGQVRLSPSPQPFQTSVLNNIRFVSPPNASGFVSPPSANSFVFVEMCLFIADASGTGGLPLMDVDASTLGGVLLSHSSVIQTYTDSAIAIRLDGNTVLYTSFAFIDGDIETLSQNNSFLFNGTVFTFFDTTFTRTVEMTNCTVKSNKNHESTSFIRFLDEFEGAKNNFTINVQNRNAAPGQTQKYKDFGSEYTGNVDFQGVSPGTVVLSSCSFSGNTFQCGQTLPGLGMYDEVSITNCKFDLFNVIRFAYNNDANPTVYNNGTVVLQNNSFSMTGSNPSPAQVYFFVPLSTTSGLTPAIVASVQNNAFRFDANSNPLAQAILWDNAVVDVPLNAPFRTFLSNTFDIAAPSGTRFWIASTSGVNIFSNSNVSLNGADLGTVTLLPGIVD